MRDRTTDVVLVGRPRHRPGPGSVAGAGTGTVEAREGYVIVESDDPAILTAYRLLRREVFVHEQGLFEVSDLDDVDRDERTRVLVARLPDGTVLGGVRIHPATEGRDLGWWRGSRLVVARGARNGWSLGSGLVRAACALAETSGALRFDATVQADNEILFHRLGWARRGTVVLHGHPHVLMDYPIARVQRLADATKAALGGLLDELVSQPSGGGGAGFVGDDGAPVPGSDLVAACDAILPSMVERDPEWAGWCAALVNINDLYAMGATPVGLLDSVGARDASFARRILRGLTDAARAWAVPVLGGHTQLGVPGALSVTALGRTERPVPGGGGLPGHAVRLTADLGGGWRPGYTGTQWDSSSTRPAHELRQLAQVVPGLDPTAAKDVSMSGLVGTTGMMAEASGCRAVLDVEDIPIPPGATTGDWLTCFPGFAIVSAEQSAARSAPPAFLASRTCGQLTEGSGVGLRWPDGVITDAIDSTVTGMGAA